MTFQDHFSSLASLYAAHRPTYPRELFEHLVSLVQETQLAWDCATGQGQAALALAEWFDRVVATDGSKEQLSQAPAHPKVEFRQALAERSGLADRSVDLITVATAMHWFDFDAFHAEVRRVAKPGGVIAAWSYGARTLIEPAIDQAVDRFTNDTLGSHWPDRFGHQWTEYRDIPFPWPRLPAPALSAVADYDLQQFLGWIRSWSAIPRFIAAIGHDPVPALEQKLRPLWGEDVRRVEWPLHFAIGRVESAAI